MRTNVYTIYIEKDEESGLYAGSVPNLPGAHSQAKDIPTLEEYIKEVIQLCIEELSEEEILSAESKFVETRQIIIS